MAITGTRSPDVPDTYFTSSGAVLAVMDVTMGLWKTKIDLSGKSQHNRADLRHD
jgi:hypothetical protein